MDASLSRNQEKSEQAMEESDQKWLNVQLPPSMTPEEQLVFLANATPPNHPVYWKELAEQREKDIHEEEEKNQQLESEISKLKAQRDANLKTMESIIAQSSLPNHSKTDGKS